MKATEQDELTALRTTQDRVFETTGALAQAAREKLVVQDGKVVKGIFWIQGPFAHPIPERPRRKRKATGKRTTVKAWAEAIANTQYDYAA